MIIAICDDNRYFIEEVEQHLRDIPYIDTILTFSHYDVLMAEVKAHRKIDVVLLDMDWKNLPDNLFDDEHGGLTIAEMLYEYCPATQVIFITAYVDHYFSLIHSRKANVRFTLSKGPDYPRYLKQYLEVLQKELEEQESRYLCISTRGEQAVKVRYHDMLYLQSADHYVQIYTGERRYEFARTMASLEKELPEEFLRVHKSYMVNMKYVRRLAREGVFLEKGGREYPALPISRLRYGDIRRQYERWIALGRR